MNHLVGFNAQQAGPQNFLGVRIYQHLHEALGFTAFARTPHLRHHHFSDHHLFARSASFMRSHAHACQRRVGVQRVGGDAVAEPTCFMVKQIRGDDFVVVIRRVGEGATSVGVTQRIDTGNVCGELIIDGDVAALVHSDAGLLQSKVVGVGHASHGH